MAPLQWRKSSYSTAAGNGECVEIAVSLDHRIRIRESDTPAAVATAAPATFAAFLAAAKAGAFDRLSG